ncbi:MAG: NAD-dependent epimerase/dehydratase [Acidobacteria bacterium]|nr:NAD-dependent epimerase/dehydratase [Acidobacteriota bacterium]
MKRDLEMTTGSGAEYTLITGGCGFIGTNLAHRLLQTGERVRVFDNLSRQGVERNLAWLRQTYGEALQVQIADTRDPLAVREAVAGASRVFHFAAQVAVTTSLTDPASDFDVNARGTVNVLEAARRTQRKPPVIFTSTNKVYGNLEDVPLERDEIRYTPRSGAIRAHGVSEERPLDFHSPYGCSKGAADQYVCDYTRSYGLRTVVVRMSCIYGPHQFGNEDQGWVAHFLIRSLNRQPITIFGDGRQVRDILFVEDLVDAFLLASGNIERLAGQAFNIGGGPERTVSLRELMQLIASLDGRMPRVLWNDWRTGDQRYYVSDTRRFEGLTGWHPRVSPREGIRLLREWLVANGPMELVQAAAESYVRGALPAAALPREPQVPLAAVAEE